MKPIAAIVLELLAYICLGDKFLGFFWPFFGPFWSFFVKMEEKYHPIAYESGRGMSLGEIPGVAQKKMDFRYDFFEKQA